MGRAQALPECAAPEHDLGALEDAVRAAKLWPSVNRIDDVYGDRNLFCACIPTEDYAK